MAFALLERGLGRVPETSRTDDQLMAAWRRGKRRAFDELYQRYKQPLYGYLMRNCGSETVADELFQDVWLRVISASGTETGILFERRMRLCGQGNCWHTGNIG